MIIPSDQGGDYLHFTCTECKRFIDYAIKITPDSPLTDEAQYNIRKWSRFKIYVQCNKCGSEGEFKMTLRPDLAIKKPD